MQLESLYQEIILDHYRHPHHAGLREPFDAEVRHVNPVCGDEVTLRVTLKDSDAGNGRDGGAGASNGRGGGAGASTIVADVSYDALGCSISQASASVLADLLTGRTVDEGMKINDEFLALMQSQGDGEPDEDVLGDAVAFAGVSKFPARIKCALLAWMAWKDATAQAMGAREPA